MLQLVFSKFLRYTNIWNFIYLKIKLNSYLRKLYSKQTLEQNSHTHLIPTKVSNQCFKTPFIGFWPNQAPTHRLYTNLSRTNEQSWRE